MSCPNCRSDDMIPISEDRIRCNHCGFVIDPAFDGLLDKILIVRRVLNEAHETDHLNLYDLDDYFKEHGMSLARFERYLDQILEDWL